MDDLGVDKENEWLLTPEEIDILVIEVTIENDGWLEVAALESIE